MNKVDVSQLERIDNYRWRIPKGVVPHMNAEGLVYATENILKVIGDDLSLTQTANVATLPGIVGKSIAMPDIHQGYGFAIGGVAAFDLEKGVVSPGGVGFDINCGVRLLKTNLTIEELDKVPREYIANKLFKYIPAGLGSEGVTRVDIAQIDEVLKNGAEWAIKNGYGIDEDLKFIESGGKLENADPSKVSPSAKKRGKSQLGSLGSGNHFIEVQEVVETFEGNEAPLNFKKGDIVILIHTGSRGLGHQVATDYIRIMKHALEKYQIQIPDLELCCAPISSPEAQDYLSAMACAANFAWANRQMILHWTRESLKSFFPDIKLDLIYDVAHNIAKFEKHKVGGKMVEVLVHRKGATRAFGPGHKEIPEEYSKIGQPVIIPGSMGTYSYLLLGTKGAEEESFGSCCHGAGRSMSRSEAKRRYTLEKAFKDLEAKGIAIKAASQSGVIEEIPEAYKDIDEVVEAVVGAGLARKVIKTRPLVVVKG